MAFSLSGGKHPRRPDALGEGNGVGAEFQVMRHAANVENRWADRHTGLLSAAAAAPGASQGFAWYSESSSPWSDTGGFVNSIRSSLASTISSASTAPGSSSGSGGGGSSGGGGGGGW